MPNVVLVVPGRYYDDELEVRDDTDELPAPALRGNAVDVPPH